MANDQTAPHEGDHWENDSRYPGHTFNAGELNENSGEDPQLPFDLEERTAKFGEEVIKFCKKIPRGPGNDRIIDQLAGSGTSVGANYCEADEAVSKKEFSNKIGTCKKESFTAFRSFLHQLT